MEKATLLLADGSVYEGYSFGAKGTVIGEIVFSTGMTGYQETLTDPSYYGHIVTQTFPLVGNYGTNSLDGESARCHLSGYIAFSYTHLDVYKRQCWGRAITANTLRGLPGKNWVMCTPMSASSLMFPVAD